jgi:hypothetical protein
MIKISETALREGCERAHDLFLLNRLRGHDDAVSGFEAVYDALGVSGTMRQQLGKALLELLPVRGEALIESTAVAAMMAGVLVGFLIADSELPCEELDLPVAKS